LNAAGGSDFGKFVSSAIKSCDECQLPAACDHRDGDSIEESVPPCINVPISRFLQVRGRVAEASETGRGSENCQCPIRHVDAKRPMGHCFKELGELSEDVPTAEVGESTTVRRWREPDVKRVLSGADNELRKNPLFFLPSTRLSQSGVLEAFAKEGCSGNHRWPIHKSVPVRVHAPHCSPRQYSIIAVCTACGDMRSFGCAVECRRTQSSPTHRCAQFCGHAPHLLFISRSRSASNLPFRTAWFCGCFF
jgi:hypothetical protein